MKDALGANDSSLVPVDNNVDEKVDSGREVGEVAVVARGVAVTARGETGSVPVGTSNHHLVPDVL